MVAIKTAAENKISVAADECEFPFGCSNLIIELFIEPHFSHPIRSLCSSYMFRTTCTMIRFTDIETRNDFPRLKYACILWKCILLYPIIEIRSDILRCNQDCRREREDVDQFLDSRSIDLAEFQHRWKPYSSTPSIQFP